jgi:hypothetical protein
MPAGRPRTVSPPPEELEELGIEMVKWFEIHPEALHVSEWYCLEKGFTETAWETMVKRSEFVGYYERAKRIVGKKYLDKTSNVREGVSQRWQRVYFKDLRDEEDETANAEAARRATALKTEAKAIEEEKQKVLQEVKRKKRIPK